MRLVTAFLQESHVTCHAIAIALEIHIKAFFCILYYDQTKQQDFLSRTMSNTHL